MSDVTSIRRDGHRSPSARMSRTQKILFFTVGWLIVLMPFLFWWNTWFGRHLSDQQLTEYLHDDKNPRHIQHALVQLGERMSRHDAAVKQWYPELVRLATDPVEEVRNTDAWVMGQDTSGAGFHETLLKMLADSSPMVRGNAALSLVRFGDATGRPQIVALLQPAQHHRSANRRIVDADRPGTAIHQGGLIAKLAVRPQADGRNPLPDSRPNSLGFANRRERRRGRGDRCRRSRHRAGVGSAARACIWWVKWKICPRFVPTNGICPTFPTMCGSRRRRPRKRSGKAYINFGLQAVFELRQTCRRHSVTSLCCPRLRRGAGLLHPIARLHRCRG